jgi:hypothetical protein
MTETEEQVEIRRYLLGYSDADVTESIEKRLIGDDEYQQEFLIVTDELIEDYLDGDLSQEEAGQFETHFLATPRRNHKLEIARALSERALSDKPATEASANATNVRSFPARPWPRQYWKIAAMVGVVIFAGLIVWAILRNRPPQFTAADQRLQDELARLNDPALAPPAGPAVQLSISPVSVRGLGEDHRAVTQSDTQMVLVRLVLVDKVYESYRATLQTVDGSELARTPQLKPINVDAGRFVEVRLPAQLLQPRSYRLKLAASTSSGTYDDVGVYPFQIVNR